MSTKDNTENGSIHSHLEWTELERTPVLDGKIFELVSSRRRSADGREAEYVLVDCPDWANVISVVQNDSGRDCFLLVRQYRQGGQCLTLEFPGGMVDSGERPEAAAARELSEETGYQAERLEHIGTTNPNPAFMTNNVHTFVAHNVHSRGIQSLDENEIVDIELVPCDDILQNRCRSFVAHGIMLIAIHWYKEWLASISTTTE